MKTIYPMIQILFLAFAYIIVSTNTSLAKDRDYLKRESAVKENMKHARRLENIVGPVLVKNASQCGTKTEPYIGAEFATKDSVGEAYGAIMEDLYGVGMHPTVTMIANQSPASNTLKIGDMITSFNGKSLTKGKQGMWDLEDAVKASGNKSLKLSVQRDGAAKSITLKPVAACNQSVRFVPKASSDVVADGNKILVTKKLLQSSASDDAVAAKIEKVLLESLN